MSYTCPRCGRRMTKANPPIFRFARLIGCLICTPKHSVLSVWHYWESETTPLDGRVER